MLKEHITTLIYCTLVLILTGGPLCSQTPYFIQYGTQNGLPTNGVHEGLQDVDGSMLFATYVGAYRFDGQSFEIIRSNSNRSSMNHYLKIRKSVSGVPWLQTISSGIYPIWGGLIQQSVYRKHTMVKGIKEIIQDFEMEAGDTMLFTQRRHPNQLRRILPNGMLDSIVCEDVHEHGSVVHLHRVKGTQRFIGFHCNNGRSHWPASEQREPLGIYRKGDNEWNIHLGAVAQPLKIGGDAHIKALEIDAELWFGTGHLILRVNLETNEMRLDTTKARVHGIDTLANGMVAISTANGAYFQQHGSKELEYLFEGYQIGNITFDHEGGTWISTLNRGILYVPSMYIRNIDLEEVQDGVAGNVYKQDRGPLIVPNFKNELIIAEGSISNPTIRKVPFSEMAKTAPARGGSAFLDGWYYKGAARVNVETEEVERFSRTVHYHLHHSESAVFGRNRDTVFDYTNARSWKIDGYNQTMCVPMVFQDELWLGSESFLNRYRVSDGSLLHERSWEVGEEQIMEMKAFKDSLLAISSSNGVYLFDGDSLRMVVDNHGTHFPFYMDIAWESSTIFWVASTNGIIRAELLPNGTYDVYPIGVPEGLSPRSIEFLSCSNDTLYVSTQQGVRFFNTKQFSRSTRLPELKLQSFQINDSNVIVEKDFMELKPEQRNFRVNYAAVTFRPGLELTYLYKLEGFHDNWVDSKEGFASYFNLPPGEYVFKAKVSNQSGETGPESVNLTILVPPTIYEQSWFWFLAGFLALGVFSGLVFWFFRQQNEKRKYSWNYANARLQALGLQMNPHFLFNALNSVQALSYGGKHEKVNSFISHLSSLIRNMLNDSDRPLITLGSELENLERYVEMERIRFENRPFTFELSIDQTLDVEQVMIPPLLLQPIVENAIWHGLLKKEGARSLEVECSQQSNGFKLVVRDNGAGYETSEPNKRLNRPSLSLKNIQNRINLYNRLGYGHASFRIKKIRGSGVDPTGTEVIFVFDS